MTKCNYNFLCKLRILKIKTVDAFTRLKMVPRNSVIFNSNC